MRISEMTTDQMADVLCIAAPCIANIMSDENLAKVLKSKLEEGGSYSRAEIMAFGANKLAEIVPLVLKDHRHDLYTILAALNGKTVEEISNQGIFDTINQVKEILEDKELLDFFGSLQQQEQTA